MKNAGQMNNNEVLLNKIVHLMETDKASDAPASALLWSKNLFRSRVVEPKTSLVQRIAAVLKIDLAPNKAVAGERSASATARQMLFSAGEIGIDLRVAEAGKGFTISGQVLGEDFSGARIKLTGSGESATAIANKLSEFKFENIGQGVYTLALIGNTKEIVIEEINIG